MNIIDGIMLYFFGVAALIVMLVVLILIAIVRWWMRGITEPVDTASPPVRTRIRQSPDWNGAA